jgi:hypothetical protein
VCLVRKRAGESRVSVYSSPISSASPFLFSLRSLSHPCSRSFYIDTILIFTFARRYELGIEAIDAVSSDAVSLADLPPQKDADGKLFE